MPHSRINHSLESFLFKALNKQTSKTVNDLFSSLHLLHHLKRFLIQFKNTENKDLQSIEAKSANFTIGLQWENMY